MNELAARELTVISALEASLIDERDLDLIVLYQEIRDEHRFAFGLLAALTHVEPPEHATPSPALDLFELRLVERELSARYAGVRDLVGGLRRDVVSRLAERARLRAVIVGAHLARVTNDDELVAELPRTLSEYFAGDETRACMRCLLDRPGNLGPIQRLVPYAYLCSSCHDEVRTAFPHELTGMVDLWPSYLRDARVLEKALSHTSKQHARERVALSLAGAHTRHPAQRRPSRLDEGSSVVRLHAGSSGDRTRRERG